MSSLHKKKRIILSNIAITALIFQFVIGKIVNIDNTFALTYVIPDGYATIVDPNFYDCVATEFKKEFSSEEIPITGLTDEQLGKIEELSCSGMGKSQGEKIMDATGLEKMTALLSLTINYNQLSAIDISNNRALTTLDLTSNQIAEIDTTNQVNLRNFIISANPLASLDVSQNSELDVLRANGCGLSSIDLSNNKKLSELLLGEYAERPDNNLVSLDLSNNTALKKLNIGHNKFTNIDLSKNTELRELTARQARFNSLDLSDLTKLTTLDLSYGSLERLDLSKNINLKTIYLQSNELTSIDITDNEALSNLYIFNNKLSSLDTSNNPNLQKLEIHNNEIKNLDISKNNRLTILTAYNNSIESLDISNNKNLSTLKLDNILLTTGILPTMEGENFVYDLSGLKFLTDGEHNHYANYSTTIVFTTDDGEVDNYVFEKDKMLLIVKNPTFAKKYAQVRAHYASSGNNANYFSYKLALAGLTDSAPESEIPVPNTAASSTTPDTGKNTKTTEGGISIAAFALPTLAFFIFLGIMLRRNHKLHRKFD